MEDLQQEINTQSLEKAQQYYRKLRYACTRVAALGSGTCPRLTLPWGGNQILFQEHLLCARPLCL